MEYRGIGTLPISRSPRRAREHNAMGWSSQQRGFAHGAKGHEEEIAAVEGKENTRMTVSLVTLMLPWWGEGVVCLRFYPTKQS